MKIIFYNDYEEVETEYKKKAPVAKELGEFFAKVFEEEYGQHNKKDFLEGFNKVMEEKRIETEELFNIKYKTK